jgi:hypothetical protein
MVLIALLACLALVRGAPAGETRCWIDKDALVAPAAFGDIAGDFLIDLSAPASVLHVTRAQEDGLEGKAATRGLSIAGRRLAGVTLAIADLDARTAKFDTTINGVIGADLLRRFVVEIDPSPCRLRLLRRRSGAWPGSVRLAIREIAGRPLIPARVTDGLKVRSGLFAIDTTDWATLVAGARLSRPQPADAPAPVLLRGVEVAGRLFEHVPAAVQPPGGDEAPDAIGMAVWSRWRLRLDIRHGRLELAPAALSPAHPRESGDPALSMSP